MITQELHKSSRGNVLERSPMYTWIGLGSIILFQILLVTGNRFTGLYYTPLQWTGLILFLDGIRKYRTGKSLLVDHPKEFAILAVISVVSWAIFEGYNVFLQNWKYLNLPDNLWIRYTGYIWAFATISPGMFLIYETIDDLLPGNDPQVRPQLPQPVFWGFVVFGLVCAVSPFVWPSTHMTPLVWMSFAFFLDPIVGKMGQRSILAEFFTGHFRSMPVFFLAGLVSGLVWEFWNYWAITKWEYYVPYWGHIKLFEMPVLGFLGFMPFIIESYAIYRFFRFLIPIRDDARYLDVVR